MPIDVAPRSEAQQVSFFESVLDSYRCAARSAGEVEHLLGLAGTTIRLRFAGDRLMPQVVPALAHLTIDEPRGPELTLCLWDSASTGVAMPPAPCDRSCFTDRGDIWGFTSRRVRTAFHWYDFSVNVLDLDRATGAYWVEGLGSLPYWSQASPLRTLLHWWMEVNGAQLVHAAAVASGDGAVLLPGKGGSGKSTTALACLGAGFGYLGDDYVVVSQDPEPAVHCLYATAKVDGGDLDRFPGIRSLVVNRERLATEKAVVRLHPEAADRLRPFAPLRAILRPRIVEREISTLADADPEELLHAARFTTLSQLPCAGRRTYEFLGTLCAAVPGRDLELGRDLDRVPEVVGGLLRSDPAPRRAWTSSSDGGERLVSVVIPVYNGEAFLCEAVDSIVRQRYGNLDVMIVDDGSTDRTPAIVGDLPLDIRYLRQPNSGVSAARNRGIRDAIADLVAFLDVDDLWSEGSLRLMLRALTEAPELDLVRGWAQVMELDPETGTYELVGSPTDSFPDYIGAGLYRKRVFARVGFFDTTLQLAEDVDWYARARELDVPMRRLDAVTLHVRRHGRNMTHGRSLQELNILQAFKRRLDRRRTGGR